MREFPQMAKKKLAAFQAKRDFKTTSEPTGPRFVVQKYTATCVTLRCWPYALSDLSGRGPANRPDHLG
jgi:hypothetical protein